MNDDNNIISFSLFKQRFMQFKKNFDEDAILKEAIVSYFELINTRNGIPIYETKKISPVSIPKDCGITKNDKSICLRRVSYGMTYGGYGSYLLRENTPLLNYIFMNFYDNIFFDLVVSNVYVDYIRDLYKNYHDKNEILSTFTKEYYEDLDNLLSYIYTKIAEKLYTYLNLNPSEYEIVFYKSFNTNNEDYIPNHHYKYQQMPYVRCYGDNEKNHIDSYKEHPMIYRNNCSLIIYPFNRILNLDCSYRSIKCDDNYTRYNYIRYTVSPTDVYYEHNIDVDEDYFTSNFSSINSECPSWIFTPGKYFCGYVIGNIFNNLYINIVHKESKECFLIEYNKYGNSKKIIETILNLSEVIHYNIINQNNLVPQNIQETMDEQRYCYKQDITTFIETVCVPNLRSFNEEALTLVNSFIDDAYSSKRLLWFNKPLTGYISAIIKHLPNASNNMKKDLIIEVGVQYSKDYFGETNKVFCDICHTNYLEFTLSKNHTIEQIINNMIVKTNAVNYILRNIKDTNIICNGSVIPYKIYKDYWMQLTHEMTIMLSIYSSEEFIKKLYDLYNKWRDKIFDSNNKLYISARSLAKDREKLYHQYIKIPTLDACNNLNLSNSRELTCDKFLTQVSYYSSTFNMHTNKLCSITRDNDGANLKVTIS